MRFFLLLLLALPLAAQPSKRVILISIDGFAAYHLTNQELELPNIRRLIRDGVWAASSETVFPSVTHPSHTTILTGVEPRLHGVLSNGLTDRETGERFHPTNKPRKEIVLVPTLFDAAKAKGLTTASFFWPETREDPSIDFNIPEVFTPENKGEIRAVPTAILDKLRAAGVPIDLYFAWYGSDRMMAADRILAEAAAYALETAEPGLLTIHFLVTDEAQHEHGPHHYLSQAAFTHTDAAVGLLMDAVERLGLAETTTFVVAADHGFHSVYHKMNVLPAFERAGVADKLELGGYGWTLSIKLKDSFDAATDAPKLEKAFAELSRHPNIARIVRPDDLHALGLPRYEESKYMRGQYMVLPDINTFLTVEPGGKMERVVMAKPSHGHGYLPSHPSMYTSLALSGAGIKKGVTIGHVRNVDIAPTVARLLGLEMPNVSGRVLEEALAQ
ncbi:MAG: sulfatase-like hydrolase/transferase [Acidobacteria bacterium]|nr:sulfatase-like hydrolase/transferase [Acidobacteriota bacterium]